MALLQSRLYNDTVLLEFDDDKHQYSVAGGRVIGVSSVTGQLAKPQLVPWAANQGAAAAMGIQPPRGWNKELKRVIKKYGKISGDACKELDKKFPEFKKARQAHTERAEASATLGTAIHAWCEKWIDADIGKSKKPNLPKDKREANGARAFLNWVKEHRVEFMATELRCYSKKYEYAGTIDCVATVDTMFCVVDFKTGGGPYLEHCLQTAAYVHALQEEGSWKQQWCDRWILNLDKDTGAFKASQPRSQIIDFNAFTALLTVANRAKLGILG